MTRFDKTVTRARWSRVFFQAEALVASAGRTVHVGPTMQADVHATVAVGLVAVSADPLAAGRDLPPLLHRAALSDLNLILPARSGILAPTRGSATWIL